MKYSEDEIRRASLARAMEKARKRAQTMTLASRSPVFMAPPERMDDGYLMRLHRQDGVKDTVFSADIDASDEKEIRQYLKIAAKAIEAGRRNTH